MIQNILDVLQTVLIIYLIIAVAVLNKRNTVTAIILRDLAGATTAAMTNIYRIINGNNK